jgi:hypothetical protein
VSTGRHLILTRVQSLEEGTYGILHFVGQAPFALTLERPWAGNEKGHSSIPAGHYRCARVMSPKFGDTFEVTNVPGRSHILFHRGNYVTDTEGCILVGNALADLDGDGVRDLAASAIAWNVFKSMTRGWREFPLSIRELTDREVHLAPVSGATTAGSAHPTIGLSLTTRP